jgi:D-serine deaminase-like pyridoxal phosphate-dependent protein
VTPVAVVDEAAMEVNLAWMAALARSAGLRLRPHAKTHKSPHVAARQLAHGASGLTVATLHEAEVFAAAGVDDLLIAHPPVGEPKLRRLRELAGRVRRLAVALDEPELAAALPSAVEVLWEVDSGLHRIGSEPGPDTVRGVRALVSIVGEERFRGLLTHGGHAYGGDRERAAGDESAALTETAHLLRQEKIPVRELSVGSTPTAGFATAGSGLT